MFYRPFSSINVEYVTYKSIATGENPLLVLSVKIDIIMIDLKNRKKFLTWCDKLIYPL